MPDKEMGRKRTATGGGKFGGRTDSSIWIWSLSMGYLDGLQFGLYTDSPAQNFPRLGSKIGQLTRETLGIQIL